MTLNFSGIVIKELHDQLSEGIIAVQTVTQFLAYSWQLVVKKISMTRFQIMQQCTYVELCIVIEVRMSVNGVINYSEKGISIHIILLTHLFYSLISKSEMNAKALQGLQ